LDTLQRSWKTPQAPRIKHAFHCGRGRPIFFLNDWYLGCGTPLGYAPLLGELRSLKPG
jgi:hypothetical protein